MTTVEAALRRIVELGRALDVEWALVGGMAVSVRTEPRFTRDVDLAVSVPDDSSAEELIGSLTREGYNVEAIVEQDAADRIATARLRRADSDLEPYVDLLFASSGIEDLIVEQAEELEVLPGVLLRVATSAHLLATKVLAADPGRPQDSADAAALAAALDDDGVAETRRALEAIESRGFNRGRDLLSLLNEVLESLPEDRGVPPS